MTLDFLHYVLIGFSIFLIILFIIQWVKWKLRKIPYTRERFAFSGVIILASLIIYLIPFLFGNNLLLELINILSTNFGNPIIISKPGLSDKILAFIFVSSVGYLIIYIFKNWKGKISIHQYELEKQREATNLISEFKIYFEGKEKLREFNPEIDVKNSFLLKEPEIESIAWHDQVYDLLTLSSSQYKINKSRDWFQKENCFISYYGKQEQPLAIFCSLNTPSIKKTEDFIKFVKNQIPIDNCIKDIKTIVAIKNTLIAKEERTISENVVEFINEKALIDELIDFTNYFSYIKESFEEKEIISGYKYTLNDVYTEPTCELKQHDNDKNNVEINNIEEYISNWSEEKKEKKHLAILGEYGQGKSVLSQRLAYSMIENIDESKRIPIIIELRGRYPKQYSNSLGLLSDWCSNFSINPKALLKLHHYGKLLIIFEGFDEMELIGDYEIRVDHFRKLWGFSTPNSKLIITGRPNFFLNDNELKTLLRTSNEYKNQTYCEEIYLKRFSKNQIEKALRNTHPETKTDILSILNGQHEQSSFVDLLSRPASLFLTSIVWNERELSQFKNNINSALVIEEFLTHSYSRQNNKEIKSALSLHERAYFMQGIAIGMTLNNGYTNQITQGKLKEIILKLYKDFPEEITKQELNLKRYNKKLQKRFDKRYNEETIFLDIRSCGVLVRDLATFDSFKFAHKSFLELLISNYITNSLIKKESDQGVLENLINNSISQAFNCNPKTLLKTSDIYKFIAEQSKRRIKFKDNITDKEKIRTIFNTIYPSKIIGMETVFKLTPLLGNDLKKGIFIMGQSLLFTVIISYILVEKIYELLLNYNFPEIYLYLIVSTIYITTVVFSNYAIHKTLIKNNLFNHILFSISNNRKNTLLMLSIESFINHDSKLVIDNGNLFLLYLICRELNILEALENILPEKMYSSCKTQEEYLNRFKTSTRRHININSR